ncbi:large ribosomal subunit protein bL12m-like [Artemia franciscana]|uniref:large ribosomal subunit protein bL12m-like n=1 Tax=Artemia franciscana TaxID=6661 RepID=UPI0032DA545A
MHVVKIIRSATKNVTQLRRCLSQAVPDTSAEAAQFPEKIQKIVNDISQLSLFEVAELNKLLKITLNISDVPVMAYGGPAAPKAEELIKIRLFQLSRAGMEPVLLPCHVMKLFVFGSAGQSFRESKTMKLGLR